MLALKVPVMNEPWKVTDNKASVPLTADSLIRNSS